jgi:hypothetical protein
MRCQDAFFAALHIRALRFLPLTDEEPLIGGTSRTAGGVGIVKRPVLTMEVARFVYISRSIPDRLGRIRADRTLHFDSRTRVIDSVKLSRDELIRRAAVLDRGRVETRRHSAVKPEYVVG